MVMLHLFRQAGFKIGVVHCNFQLRGEASAGDEDLVKNTCGSQNIPFYVKRFDTTGYAEERGLSIQMAARELRYSFFNLLLSEEAYDYVATAHHHNDSIETVLLNLVKGTGIDGLSGIPQKKDKVIRPLLFASKEMLVGYAKDCNLSWREDVSNASDHYQRNFIRHQIIPKLKELNPNIENTFQVTLQRLNGSRQFAKEYIDLFREQAISFTENRINIDKIKLLESPAPSVLLWELLKEKGFNFDQCTEIVATHQSGKKFSTSVYELFIDRDFYIVDSKNTEPLFDVTISSNTGVVKGRDNILRLDTLDKNGFVLSGDTDVAYLDFDRIDFPLRWRAWWAGDHFIPLGMDHSKKLSDFFIDRKISIPSKDKITVIESGGKIVWVVGLRIHDHFKVSESTTRILAIRLEKNTE